MKKLITIFILLMSSLVFADPWIVYGTVTLDPSTVIDNPHPNSLGIIGEVSSLPYTVPLGKKLTITYMQVEGPACDYGSDFSQFGMGIWVGSLPATNTKWFLSCTTVGGSNQNSGFSCAFPEGSIINLRMMNNTRNAWVNGFCVQGDIENAP